MSPHGYGNGGEHPDHSRQGNQLSLFKMLLIIFGGGFVLTAVHDQTRPPDYCPQCVLDRATGEWVLPD